MRVLVLNAGSSTLKWALLDGRTRATLDAGSDAWAAPALERRAAQLMDTLRAIGGCDAVGHRVVHGGARFRDAVAIDQAVRAELETLSALDPLHMRPALAGIDAVSAALERVPQVAAFDTAFHASIPDAAGYALPRDWTERFGLRRFGFHGLSVEYAVARSAALLGALPARLVVCHLGSGCSITAVARGRSLDTTMGFTPLDGVMMATRSGAVDPGLLLHLQARGVGVDELADALANRSGLYGVSGVSGDLRRVLAAADAHDARAQAAYAQFIWSLRRAVGAMAGVLDGVDAIAFTGGIGEHSARVRSDVAAALRHAGLRLDERHQDPARCAIDDPRDDAGDGVISAADSLIAALRIVAREDLVVLDAVTRVRGA
jgi:acetate kinase